MADHSDSLRHNRIHLSVYGRNVTKPVIGATAANSPFFRIAAIALAIAIFFLTAP
jgi:hypothetical protein